MGIINIKTWKMLQYSPFFALFVKYPLNYEETDEYKIKKATSKTEVAFLLFIDKVIL